MSSINGWWPVYIGDYLGDTSELDGPKHGAYLLLLMHYWRTGPLPMDDATLAQIARTDIRVWKKTVGPSVKAFFTLGADGRLHQKRMDAELAKAAECHQRAAEKRQTDNDRLKSWRAKQGQDGRHPPERTNGKDPPPETNETRFTGVSPPVSERVSKRSLKRAGNADETRTTSTITGTETSTEKKKESYIKQPFNSETREAEAVPSDALDELMEAAGIEKPPRIDRTDDALPSLDPLLMAHIKRATTACRMTIPYGEVRSVEAQLAALDTQPGAVGADLTMGLKWQPAEPVRSVADMIADLEASTTPEQRAKAERYAQRSAAPAMAIAAE